MWPRPVEPRLTGASAWRPCKKVPHADRLIDEVQCGQPTTPTACDEIIDTHAHALRILATQPQCTDNAIAALKERFARIDPAAMSDLAAAYYVRAQREDRASDLLEALDAADRAVASAPHLAAALFNRALAQEALGLSKDAIESWDAFLKEDGQTQWAAEARQHRDALLRIPDAATQWAETKKRLVSADVDTAARLIAPFHLSAQHYVEDELLPQGRLAEARTIALALQRLSNDHYLIDVVNAAAPLRKAHTAFQEARAAQIAFHPAKYDQAASLLERGGSPLSLTARLNDASALSYKLPSDAALAFLDPIQRAAKKRDYGHLLGRLHATRAFVLLKSRYAESLEESDAAFEAFERVHDQESRDDLHMRRIGLLLIFGEKEQSWHEALAAVRGISRMVELRTRHALLGDTAATALALGHARTALRYQETAVRMIQKELAGTPPDQLDRISGSQKQLGMALRARAAIEVRLEDYDGARTDLEESLRLLADDRRADPNILEVVLARVAEVQGDAKMRVNPKLAAADFTRAMERTPPAYRTFRAALLAKRAEAHRKTGRNADAENDLRDSLKMLGEEEKEILEHRGRGENEDLWSSYFSRFQDTYRILIRQLIEEGHADEAFTYVERARAFEPLDLIRQGFGELATKNDRLQDALPAGTAVLEYCVLDDRTYVWIISHGRAEVATLPIGREAIEEHASKLRRGVEQPNITLFETELITLYEMLLAVPLSKAKPTRLVIIPDGPMHGLPFAALRNPETERYLIEDMPLSIEGSAALYLFSLRRDHELQSSRNRSVLLIGDPSANLEFARKEAEEIAMLYSPHVQMRLRQEATARAFLQLAPESAIVHVAAHGIVDPHSSLVFADAKLDAQQLLTKVRLRQTRLVVLGACSSAEGATVGPEGLAPLVRPLIVNGVPAVVGTLWDINDATAKEVLVSFHRHYRNGSDAAAALQAAQRDQLRKRQGLNSVLAWAPFQVIGHSSSPFAPAHERQKEKPP